MADTNKTLSSAEFSKMTGIAVSTINKMLRQGDLRGEKRSGKWAIFQEELNSAAITQRNQPTQTSTAAAAKSNTPRSSSGGKRYDVASFARMTYLTENGVRQWLKTGRLSGGTGAYGKPFVDATNLDRADLQHLIRP